MNVVEFPFGIMVEIPEGGGAGCSSDLEDHIALENPRDRRLAKDVIELLVMAQVEAGVELDHKALELAVENITDQQDGRFDYLYFG